MSETYSISIDAAGSSQKNAQSRNINTLFPFSGGTYRTVSKITRKGGIWCSCGGKSQSVTMQVYEQMLSGETVIKTSASTTCKSHGTGPADENYATTIFDNWTQDESNAAISAWEAGTLVIKRFVSILSYTSSGHGTPTFRDGYYSDTIAIEGATAPFTNYAPVIGKFEVMRSENGTTENPESTSVYATIKLSMTDTAGLNDNAKLLAYHQADADPSTASDYVDLTSVFGLTTANLNTEKTIQIPGTWSNGVDYYFMLVFSAGEEEASALDIAQRATVPLYISETNNGVAIGQYSSATADDAKFECRWPAYFYGGIVTPTMSNVQGGVTADITIKANGYVDTAVTFAKEYTAAPVVVVSFASTETDRHFGANNVAVLDGSITTTSFTVRTWNDDSDAHKAKVSWMAYLAP